MDVFTAAHIFYKYAQEATQSRYKDIIAFSNKLCAPNFSTNPDSTIDTALLATLQNEVQKMEAQERFPITRAESKSLVQRLYNYAKAFHTNLMKNADVNILTPDIQKVRNEWNQFKQRYLNNDFLNELDLAKSEVQAEEQSEWEKRKMFWKKIIDQIEGSISNIEKLLKDQLSGSSETELKPQPV